MTRRRSSQSPQTPSQEVETVARYRVALVSVHRPALALLHRQLLWAAGGPDGLPALDPLETHSPSARILARGWQQPAASTYPCKRA